TGVNTLVAGNWYYIVSTYSTSAGLTTYVNGSVDATAAANGALNTTSVTFGFGFDPGVAGRDFNGVIDEVRVSDSVRSSDWVTTEFNNQSSTSTFYIYGSFQAQNRGA